MGCSAIEHRIPSHNRAARDRRVPTFSRRPGRLFWGDKVAVQPKTIAVSLWEKTPKTLLFVCVTAPVILLNACNSDLLVATWICRPSSSTSRPDSGLNYSSTWFDFPWSTGFENDFNDYSEGCGSCYSLGSASYTIVEAPVHSGRHAAAFTVIGDGTNAGPSTNSRCHRDGILPQQAYYGAWYYIPALATNSGNWNLIHFQGGDGVGPDLFNLWDVSLVNNANGGLRLTVADYVPNSSIPDVSDSPPIPIGSWFHIVMFLKRASDATGEISVSQSVSQDAVEILHATNLITDDTPYGQWYVGNLATSLNPAESTLYVDDVSVGREP
jgi:hypothetical protein